MPETETFPALDDDDRAFAAEVEAENIEAGRVLVAMAMIYFDAAHGSLHTTTVLGNAKTPMRRMRLAATLASHASRDVLRAAHDAGNEFAKLRSDAAPQFVNPTNEVREDTAEVNKLG